MLSLITSLTNSSISLSLFFILSLSFLSLFLGEKRGQEGEKGVNYTKKRNCVQSEAHSIRQRGPETLSSPTAVYRLLLSLSFLFFSFFFFQFDTLLLFLLHSFGPKGKKKRERKRESNLSQGCYSLLLLLTFLFLLSLSFSLTKVLPSLTIGLFKEVIHLFYLLVSLSPHVSF